jgi:hypothetical protein
MMKVATMFRVGLFAVAVIGLSVGAAQASTIQITTRAGLGANDFIDWSSVGAMDAIVTNPKTTSTNFGIGASVDQSASSTFQRLTEQVGDWQGIFSPGDALLWTTFQSATADVVTIAFNAPVSAVGAQIQSDLVGAYIGQIQAFNGATLLATFTAGSNNTKVEDNSAAFLGVKSDTANITSVTFTLTAAPDFAGTTTQSLGDFAINRLSIADVVAVPEPATLSLLGLGLAAAAARRRRNRK